MEDSIGRTARTVQIRLRDPFGNVACQFEYTSIGPETEAWAKDYFNNYVMFLTPNRALPYQIDVKVA
jgi:hypothetical protein